MRRLLPLSSLVCLLILLPRPAAAQFGLQEVVGGLTAPVALVQMPGDARTQVVVEQGGRVRRVTDGVLQPDDFLDLSGSVTDGGELGLLGLAFSPSFADDGRVFVYFINTDGNTVVARFTCTADLWHADVDTRRDLTWPDGLPYITQPTGNHKGGQLAFGPDGFLYIGLGDGGPGEDPDNHAQDPLLLLGKMLRIDVNVADDDPEGYDVPADNPFAGRGDVLNEIWALGLRNPWRWSFDDPSLGGTGAMFIGDVGQVDMEEVDFAPPGAGGRNYGWRVREGVHEFDTTLPPFSDALIDPIFAYGHGAGASAVIGGVVYHGTALGPAYQGRYFFGDFGTNRVWSLGVQVDPATGEAISADVTEVSGLQGAVMTSAFGVDAAGEMYLVSYGFGTVYRVVPAAAAGGNAAGCSTPDPFASLGGGVCVNHAWLPPGMGGSETGSGSEGAGGWESGGSSPPPSTCATPDPFASLGGGVCLDGGWVPPWLAPPPPSTPPPSTPPPSTPPPSSSGDCSTPDPFASMGGGVCANGGWLPPGSSTPPPSMPPPTNTTPPPSSDTGCATPDPFASLGGGVCANGGWLPPGSSPPSTPPPSSPPPPPVVPSESGCVGIDPFTAIPTLKGVCVNGGWIPVPR